MDGGETRTPGRALVTWVVVAASVLTLALAGAGCGSDDDGGSGGGGTTAAHRTRTVDAARQAKLMATGKKVFFDKCHSCHSMLGRKHTAPVIETEAPDFDEVSLPKPAYIRERVLMGGFDMQSFQGELTEFQIDAVVAYVGATAGRNVDNDAADESPADELSHGEQLFAERCHRCHGIAGEPRTGRPMFPGTDFNLVKPSQAFAIRKTLEGLEDAMPSFKGRLTKPELHDVAAYVASVAAEDPE